MYACTMDMMSLTLPYKNGSFHTNCANTMMCVESGPTIVGPVGMYAEYCKIPINITYYTIITPPAVYKLKSIKSNEIPVCY